MGRKRKEKGERGGDSREGKNRDVRRELARGIKNSSVGEPPSLVYLNRGNEPSQIAHYRSH